MTKIEIYKKYAVETVTMNGLTDQAYLLQTKQDEPCGVLFIDATNESICMEKHCEDCWNEPVWIMQDITHKYFQYDIVWGVVSEEKFQRIQNGETRLISSYALGERLV